MSGSFESMRWNACVHRLDLGLYSHLKEFLGNGVINHVNSKGKIPSTGGSEKGQTRDAALRRTPTLRTRTGHTFLFGRPQILQGHQRASP